MGGVDKELFIRYTYNVRSRKRIIAVKCHYIIC